MINALQIRTSLSEQRFSDEAADFAKTQNPIKWKGENSLLRNLTRRFYATSRPVIDIVVSSICLSLALPVIIFFGIVIKLTSKGPMFYTQERVGKDGSLFEIIKLRTMVADSESENGAVWAKNNDNRVTIIGRFLRKTHLDELPQLVNVIKGEMSIIGPRPERPVFVERFKKEIPGYDKRLNVKPGITGMAQCYYKYDESIQDVCRKLRYDLTYVKNMGWLLDLKIIALTAIVSFVKANGQG